MQPCTSLAALPVELLNRIIRNVRFVTDLANLSQTNKFLHVYIQKYAYHQFLLVNFPSFELPCLPDPKHARFYRDAVHELTSLSRNLDRRAFIAQIVLDAPCAKTGRRQKGNERRDARQQRQTMGYQPIIDSYEHWYGGSWTSRLQVIAYAAGPTLHLSVEDLDKRTFEGQHIWKSRDRRVRYRHPLHVDGRDDIVSLKLLPSIQIQEDVFKVLLGRASGVVDLVQMDPTNGSASLIKTFLVNKGVAPVYIDMSCNEMVVIRQGTHSISLCSLELEQHAACTVDMSGLFEGTGVAHRRITHTQFLDSRRLAFGLSKDSTPLAIVDISVGGTSEIRFNKRRMFSFGKSTSVYCLGKLSTCNMASSSNGDVFLSGSYDGITRLHDTRSANSVVAQYVDEINSFGIYSLCTFGREQFAAGSGQHSILQIYDLRIPGTRRYFSADMSVNRCHALQKHETLSNDEWNDQQTGWNCNIGSFLQSGASVASRRYTARNTANSSVYSLSRPSDTSSTLFVGLEDCVVRMDWLSIIDRWPAPSLGTCQGQSLIRIDSPCQLKSRWDANSQILRVPMHERVNKYNTRLELRTQTVIGAEMLPIAGLDERWASVERQHPRR